MSSQRQCLALDLIDDTALIDQYEHLHQKIWPHVSEHMRQHGVLEMQIWRLGTRLFLIMDTAPGFSVQTLAQAAADDALVQEWEVLKWRFSATHAMDKTNRKMGIDGSDLQSHRPTLRQP